MNQQKETEKSASSENVLLPPSKKQKEAIDFLVHHIENREPVIAFVAPGGCGKTFSLKHIQRDSRLSGFEMAFTATTNKAAAVMKSEGLKGAKTLHATISKIINTEMYLCLENLFKINKASPDVKQEIPQLVLDFFEDIQIKPETIFDYKNEKELIAENKVNSFDKRIFSHYIIGDYKGGVCWVDEGSMLPTKPQYQKDEGKDGKLKLKAIGLDLVCKVFDTVVIVGDDSQLPPINGDSSFEGVPKATLTENFRADKSLLRILDYVRNGKDIANFIPESGENVRIVPSLSSEYFNRNDLIKNKVTHIVYKNKTRKDITNQIRAELNCEPTIDEPIVYKGANIDNPPDDMISKNETGFFNGVMGEWENHSQIVQGRNFDEYGTGFTYLQYAYAITAHTAQGSSFDYVVVHNDDVPHFIDKETKRKWLYTAISRARKGIVVVY